uniref:Uncharacterized protein n=1 Tax=Arion vulgaris TaxID=1028688 RepID=A0A0B7BCH2_9EUPU
MFDHVILNIILRDITSEVGEGMPVWRETPVIRKTGLQAKSEAPYQRPDYA